jgi:enoyl-CoA hydratase/carnithine racemase
MAGTIGRVVSDKTCWVSIDNGPRGVLNPDLMRDLSDTLKAADTNPDVEAVVLTGTGTVFCAGLDIDALRAGADPVEFAKELVALLKLIPQLGKPVVCAVNGDALASGFSLVLTTDYAIAVEGAKLGTFEASVGVWPMIAQVPVLQRLLPRFALENVMSGEPFETDRALQIGAINQSVPAEQLKGAVQERIPRLVRAGPALAAGRRSFYRFLDLGYDEALDQSLQEFVAMLRPDS